MHRQVLNKFDIIKQGQKTVQELIQELTKYAAWMMQYLDDYSFRRWLIAALRPSLQKEVLCRGIIAEFSSMQDILEKVNDIKDSSHYDIGSQMSVETAHSSVCVRYQSPMDLQQVHPTLPSSTIPSIPKVHSYFHHISNTPPFVPVPLVSPFVPMFPVSLISVSMPLWSSHLLHKFPPPHSCLPLFHASTSHS